MVQYFLVINQEQAGPFSIEQLALQKLTPQSLVWTAGMDNWTALENIPELLPLLLKPVAPPPVVPVNKPVIVIPKEDPVVVAHPTAFNSKSETENATDKLNIKHKVQSQPRPYYGLEKNVFYAICAGMAILGVVAIMYISKSIKRSNLEKKNQQTELQIKKAETDLARLNMLSEKELAQAKKEQERRIQEIEGAVKRRVSEIETEIKMNEEELVIAKQKFSEATAFKPLRSAETRNSDINEAMDQVDYIESEIERLKKEIKIVELNGQRSIENAGKQ